jgi:hypothetical protein
MKKSIFVITSLTALFSCNPPESETENPNQEIPELFLVDSLVVDRLTQFTLVDVNEDRSSYLLYDWKTKEFMNVTSSGEIKALANLNGDGKNSYQDSYFVGAKFKGNDKILIQTYAGLYTYDLEFNLQEKRTDSYDLVTRRVGGSRGFDTYNEYLYTFSIEENDMKGIYDNQEFSRSYPFLTIRDIESYDVINSVYIPETTSLAKNPGFYNNLDPIVHFEGNLMHVLFPNSPELYSYDLPSLELKKSFDLNPGEAYRIAKPHNPEQGLKGFFNSLAAGEYQYFTFSNGYLLTIYDGAAPQDAVDALPQDMVGGEKFNELVRKYKDHFYYQIFKDEEKIWEGKWDIKLEVVRDLIYSNAKVGEDPNAVEKDVQTLYFYEIR